MSEEDELGRKINEKKFEKQKRIVKKNSIKW